MKTFLLCSLLLTLPGGDREAGLAHYAAGRYAEAAAAFRRAIVSEGESAELQFNLALASWRAGELDAAELAVEKYAALGGAVRADLHAGVLGGVRYAEAKALEAAADAAMQPPSAPPPPPADKPLDPLQVLGQALVKAQQARDHFVRGATSEQSPELLRNLERTLRYIAELERKIEALEQQREEQQDDEQDKKDEQKSDEPPPQDGEKKPDPDKENEKGEGEQNEQQQGDPKPDEKQAENEQGAEQPPEPQQQPPEKNKPDGGKENESGEQRPDAPPPPEPKPGEEQPETQPEPQPRNDAPGEGADGRELTPEQAQRLLEQLKDLDKQLQTLRGRARSGRKPVERDW